jgi:DNA-binding NarL/FixJ family response regulator
VTPVQPITVLVVDDHAVVREGIRHVLSGPEFTVVGEGASAAEAVSLAASQTPDVIVLDISMPGGSGLHAVPEVLERSPLTRVLMLSVHDDLEYVLESVRIGAHGYLRKDSTPGELRAAIAAIHGGASYYSPQVAQRLAEALRSGHTPSDAPKAPKAADVLTKREREILGKIAEGNTNKEIGAALGISTRTVEAHRDSLMKKIEIRTVAGLTRYALDQGIIKP